MFKIDNMGRKRQQLWIFGKLKVFRILILLLKKIF